MSALRYGGWQARDFVTERAPLPTLLALFLFVAFAVDPRYRKDPSTFLQDPTMASIVRGAMMLFVVAVVLFAVIGSVSEERKSGNYRLIFAKPIGILPYYIYNFVIRGILVCATVVAVIGVASVLFRSGILWPIALATPLAYVAIGGLGFMLSANTKHDGIVLVTGCLTAHLLVDHVPMLRYVLPPVWVFREYVTMTTNGIPVPALKDVLWAIAYGSAAFAFGLYGLARHRFSTR